MSNNRKTQIRKNITVPEDVYDEFMRLKGDHENKGDLLRRLIGRSGPRSSKAEPTRAVKLRVTDIERLLKRRLDDTEPAAHVLTRVLDDHDCIIRLIFMSQEMFDTR